MKTISEDNSPDDGSSDEVPLRSLYEIDSYDEVLSMKLYMIRVMWMKFSWRWFPWVELCELISVNKVHLTKLCESVSVNEITVKMIRLMKFSWRSYVSWSQWWDCSDDSSNDRVMWISLSEDYSWRLSVRMIRLMKFTQWSSHYEVPWRSSLNEVMWMRLWWRLSVRKIHIIKSFNEVMWRRFLIK